MDIHDAQQFLVNCTASHILHHGELEQEQEQEGKQATLQEIVMARLGGHMLKNVANFEHCLSLRICILANNFITNIAALSECVRLVRLDLSGNQIAKLPGVDFWKRFAELQLLNLHDNNMSARQHIMGLSGCPNLVALTLHDTPVSLKENYRHCIVNTLWSLKALDKCVISDEEVIEGFTLPPKFKKMSPHLAVDLHPASKMEPFKSEMKLVMKIISKINHIQAIYSPTLIIQRWIRGHLTRKSLGITSAACRWRKISKHLTPIVSDASAHEDQPHSDKQPAFVIVPVADKHTDEESEGNLKIKLFVNLLTGSAKVVGEEQAESAAPDKTLKDCCPPYNTPQHSNVLTLSSPEDTDVKDVSDELQSLALEMTNINVFGYKAVLHRADPIADMFLSRRQTGRDVRRHISQLHTQKPNPKEPPRPRLPMITAEQRLMDRCHASFTLKVFHIVESTNRARERDEAHRKRVEHVVQAQARREEAKEYRDVLTEARRKELSQREQERAELQEALLRLKASQNRDVLLARERHALCLERRKLQREEQAKVSDLCCRQASLCKVITSKQAQQRRKVMLQEMQSLVTSQKHAVQQKNLTQRYLERRKQGIKESTMISRLSVDFLQGKSAQEPAPGCQGPGG